MEGAAMNLNQWLKANRHTTTGIAKVWGVPRQTVKSWRNGTTPRPAMQKQIETWTGGCVTAQAWGKCNQ